MTTDGVQEHIQKATEELQTATEKTDNQDVIDDLQTILGYCWRLSEAIDRWGHEAVE